MKTQSDMCAHGMSLLQICFETLLTKEFFDDKAGMYQSAKLKQMLKLRTPHMYIYTCIPMHMVFNGALNGIQRGIEWHSKGH